METLIGLLAATIVSLILVLVFYVLLQLSSGQSGNKGCSLLIFLYFILFLPVWAGGLLLKPIGPEVSGVRILNFVVVGLFFGLIIAAVLLRQLGKLAKEDKSETEAEPHQSEWQPEGQTGQNAERRVNPWFAIAFWLLVSFTIVAIFFGVIAS